MYLSLGPAGNLTNPGGSYPLLSHATVPVDTRSPSRVDLLSTLSDVILVLYPVHTSGWEL